MKIGGKGEGLQDEREREREGEARKRYFILNGVTKLLSDCRMPPGGIEKHLKSPKNINSISRARVETLIDF